MEAGDIHVSSSKGGDDCDITECGCVLLGLHIDGSLVTGTDERDWVGECDRLSGVMPPPTAIHGGQVKLTWLHEQFTVPPITDVEAQQHTRAYILHMIGTQLFPDYSKNKIYLR